MQSYLSVDPLVMLLALHQSVVLHVPSSRQSVNLPFLYYLLLLQLAIAVFLFKSISNPVRLSGSLNPIQKYSTLFLATIQYTIFVTNFTLDFSFFAYKHPYLSFGTTYLRYQYILFLSPQTKKHLFENFCSFLPSDHHFKLSHNIYLKSINKS